MDSCCGVVGSNSDSFVTFPTFLPFIPVVRLGNRRLQPFTSFRFRFHLLCPLFPVVSRVGSDMYTRTEEAMGFEVCTLCYCVV